MQVTKTTPLFSATLRPDRLLPATGGWVALTLAAIVATPFVIAMPEVLWPALTAFSIATASLIWFGLRQGRLRQTSQTVTLWPEQLEITTLLPGQERQLQRFALHAVRLRLERDGFERTTGVFLRHGADELELGAFLSVDDKSSFAKAFGRALRQARKAA